MPIGEKVIEVGLAGASAAIATFAIYLWGQTETLEREIAKVRSDIVNIRQDGAIELGRIKECENLTSKILESSKIADYRTKEEAKDIFEKRGCNTANMTK